MEFKLNEKEIASAELFRLNHKGHGQFVYMFTPTGIGTNVQIKCLGCNELKDITDYNLW